MYSVRKKNPAFRPLVSSLEWHKLRRKSGASIISLLIAITIIFPCLTWAFEAGTYPLPGNQVMFNNHPVKISPKLGTITESFQGSERVVVHIQDLHCNYEVQDNIAKMIGRLAGRQGLKLVAVEAAAGPVNVSRLSSFPIESVRKETARYLMKQGRITGPELYAAMGKHAIRLEGIENRELYEANRAAVKKFLNCQSQGSILDLRETLNELKRRVYNKRLGVFDKTKKAFRQGDIPLLKYCVYLYQYGRQQGWNHEDCPHLSAYVSQRTHFFPKTVDSDELFKELEQLDKLLRTGLYTTPAQAEMDAWQDRLDIMEKLLNISALPEELAKYRAAPEKFKVQRFLDYIARHAKPGEFRLEAEVYELDRYLDKANEFYQVADERSLVFVENMVQRMDRQNAKIAVLVTGGYHTDKVLGELKQRGVSYICVKPRLSRQDIVNPYLALLRNQRTPLEKLLARNQNILGLETLWPLQHHSKLSPEQSEFKNLLVHLLEIGALADSFKTGARSVVELRRRYEKKIGAWAKAPNQKISILWELVDLKARAVFAPFNTGITVMILDRIRSRIKTGAKLDIYSAPVLVIPSSEAGRLKRHFYAVAERFPWNKILGFLPSRGFPLLAGIIFMAVFSEPGSGSVGRQGGPTLAEVGKYAEQAPKLDLTEADIKFVREYYPGSYKEIILSAKDLRRTIADSFGIRIGGGPALQAVRRNKDWRITWRQEKMMPPDWIKTNKKIISPTARIVDISKFEEAFGIQMPGAVKTSFAARHPTYYKLMNIIRVYPEIERYCEKERIDLSPKAIVDLARDYPNNYPELLRSYLAFKKRVEQALGTQIVEDAVGLLVVKRQRQWEAKYVEDDLGLFQWLVKMKVLSNFRIADPDKLAGVLGQADELFGKTVTPDSINRVINGPGGSGSKLNYRTLKQAILKELPKNEKPLSAKKEPSDPFDKGVRTMSGSDLEASPDQKLDKYLKEVFESKYEEEKITIRVIARIITRSPNKMVFDRRNVMDEYQRLAGAKYKTKELLPKIMGPINELIKCEVLQTSKRAASYKFTNKDIKQDFTNKVEKLWPGTIAPSETKASKRRAAVTVVLILISMAFTHKGMAGWFPGVPQPVVSQEDVRQEVKKVIWFLNLIKKSNLALTQDSLDSLDEDLKRLRAMRKSLVRKKVLGEDDLAKIRQNAELIKIEIEEKVKAEAEANLWEWKKHKNHEQIAEMLCEEIFTPLELAVVASIEEKAKRLFKYRIYGQNGKKTRARDENEAEEEKKVLVFYGETIAWMKQKKLELPEMARIIAYWPDVLAYGKERLQSREALFEELGVSPEAVIRIFKKTPYIYGLDPDNLSAEITWLEGVAEKWEAVIDIPGVLETHPTWAGLSAEGKVNPTLNLYSQMQNRNNHGYTIIRDLDRLLSRNITILEWIVEEMRTEPDVNQKVFLEKVIAVHDVLRDEVKQEKGVTPARMLLLARTAVRDQKISERKDERRKQKARGQPRIKFVVEGRPGLKAEKRDQLLETEKYLRSGIKIIINFKTELTRWLSWHGFADLCSELEIMSEDEWGNIVWKLGNAAFSGHRAALDSIIKLIREPSAPDDLKVTALEVLGYVMTQHRSYVIQKGETVIPNLEKNLRSFMTSEELKEMSIKTLRWLASEGSHLALEAITRQMPYLERFINAPQIDNDLRIASMQAVGYAASKNIPSAIAVIANSTPTLVNFVIRPQTPLALRICSLEALGQGAAQGDQRVISALEEIMPFLEALMNETSHKLNAAVIKVVSYTAAGGGKLAAGSMEKSIKSPDSEYLSKKLYYLSFAISKARPPVLQAAERLVPFLEPLVTGPSIALGLRIAAMRTLGTLGAEGNKIALAALERVLPDLEHAMTTPPDSDAFKDAMAILQGLPLKIKGPELKLDRAPYPVISLDEVLRRVESPRNPRFAGRSLVYDLPDGNILEIKILRDQGDLSTLSREPFYWRYLKTLKQEGHFKGIRFDLGRVLEFSGSDVIKLRDMPLKPPGNIRLHPDLYAVCLVQQGEYYSYPNSTPSEGRPSKSEAKEEFFRAAYLSGYLACLGIPQGEIVPFMHSVMYANKRRDQGQLLWWRRGRVDSWIRACDYPNFGKIGPRDTEHIISWGVDKAPYGYEDYLGLFHLLGKNEFDLELAVGSYFRNKDRSRMGLDNNGNPVDARDLFDEELLKEMIVGIFLFYHEGFIRAKYNYSSACNAKHLIQRMEKRIGKLSFDLETLTQRMIEEMGVDRYIRTKLTKKEQSEMSNEEFGLFLLDNGYSESEIARFEKGKQELPLINGPHLGNYGGETSLPEINAAIEAMATLCIAGKYKADYMKAAGSARGIYTRGLPDSQNFIPGSAKVNEPFSLEVNPVLKIFPWLHRKLIIISTLGLRLFFNKQGKVDSGQLAARINEDTGIKFLIRRTLAGIYADPNYAGKIQMDIRLPADNRFLEDYRANQAVSPDKIYMPACVLEILDPACPKAESMIAHCRYALARQIFIYIVQYKGLRDSDRMRAGEDVGRLSALRAAAPAGNAGPVAAPGLIKASKIETNWAVGILKIAGFKLWPAKVRMFLHNHARQAAPEVYFMHLIREIKSAYPGLMQADAAGVFAKLKTPTEFLEFLNGDDPIAKAYRSLVYAATPKEQKQARALLAVGMINNFQPARTAAGVGSGADEEMTVLNVLFCSKFFENMAGMPLKAIATFEESGPLGSKGWLDGIKRWRIFMPKALFELKEYRAELGRLLDKLDAGYYFKVEYESLELIPRRRSRSLAGAT